MDHMEGGSRVCFFYENGRVMDDGKEFKIGPRYKDKIRKSYIELMRIS